MYKTSKVREAKWLRGTSVNPLSTLQNKGTKEMRNLIDRQGTDTNT